mgnify:CR=1 FL=1
MKIRVLTTAVACASLMGTSLAPSIATAQSAKLEEIVVTARKRVESLQDVPIAVTAILNDSTRVIGFSHHQHLHHPAEEQR